jgi:hypothetical protein
MMRRAAPVLLLVALALSAWFVLRNEERDGGSAIEIAAPTAKTTAGTLPDIEPALPGAELIRKDVSDPLRANPLRAAPLFVSGRFIVSPAGWPEPLEPQLFFGDDKSTQALECAPDGAFRYHLADAQTVSYLTLGEPLRIRRTILAETVTESTVRVDGPREGVEIEVEVLPHVDFLVLNAEDLNPLPHRMCSATIFSGPEDSMMLGAATDGLGHSRIARERLVQATHLDFQVHNPPTGSSFTQRWPVEDLLSREGPVEILVRSGPMIAIYAHDAFARPIAGAFARLGWSTSNPTGPDGLGEYRDAVPHCESVLFTAPGHVDTEIQVPDPPPTLLDVPMRRASTLTVRLTAWHEAGLGAYRVDVRFFGEGAKVSTGSAKHSTGNATHGNLRGGSRSNSRTSYSIGVELSFADDGVVVLDGIFSDLPADVTLHYAGVPLHRERIQFTLDGVKREISTDGRFAARAVSGSVVDETGAPLAGAGVHFGERTGFYLSALTDAAGVFRFGPLPQQAEVLAWAQPEGHLRGNILIPAGDHDLSNLRLVVPHARVVHLTIFGPDGAPIADLNGRRIVPEAFLTDETPVGEASSRDLAESALPAGEWCMTELPPGFVVFRAQTSELEGVVTHHTDQPRAILILKPR